MYEGYLIKVANAEDSNDWFTIPHNFILEKTYKGTYSTMDVNSTRTGDAVLDRNVVPHKVAHCEMMIKPLNNHQVASLFGANGGISTRYENALEKSVYAKIYVTELDDYVIAKCYIPDIEFTVRQVVNKPPYSVKYEQFKLEVTGY